jgi:hypothetical protein
MFAVRYDMQNMPLCMQNTPAICANEVIGSSAGLVPINALLASVVYPYLRQCVSSRMLTENTQQNRADDGRREVTWNHERNVSVSRENAVRVLP